MSKADESLSSEVPNPAELISHEDFGSPPSEQWHNSRSSEQEPSASNMASQNVLFEPCFMVQTHGGGTLEKVPGLSPKKVMTKGLYVASEEIPAAHAQLPSAEELAFERDRNRDALRPQSQFGTDDRVRVRDTTGVPWRCICQLVITFADGSQARGTGWFIGPRTVITAGHCVYDHRHRGWAQSAIVYPGANGKPHDTRALPFGSTTASLFKSVDGWIDQRMSSHDYGAMLLNDRSLGDMVGWFGFSALQDQELKALLVNTSGYPPAKGKFQQFFCAARVTGITDYVLSHQLDTTVGQSGSPIWRTSGNERTVIAIHNYGSPNQATRINSAVYKNLLGWKALGL